MQRLSVAAWVALFLALPASAQSPKEELQKKYQEKLGKALLSIIKVAAQREKMKMLKRHVLQIIQENT